VLRIDTAMHLVQRFPLRMVLGWFCLVLFGGHVLPWVFAGEKKIKKSLKIKSAPSVLFRCEQSK